MREDVLLHNREAQQEYKTWSKMDLYIHAISLHAGNSCIWSRKPNWQVLHCLTRIKGPYESTQEDELSWAADQVTALNQPPDCVLSLHTEPRLLTRATSFHNGVNVAAHPGVSAGTLRRAGNRTGPLWVWMHEHTASGSLFNAGLPGSFPLKHFCVNVLLNLR